MLNLSTLLWYFYKPLLKFNFIFTSWALYSLWREGMEVIGVTLIIKLIGYATGTGYQYFMANHTYYYYRNAGYPVRKLYALSYTLDFIIYLLALGTFIAITYVHVKG